MDKNYLKQTIFNAAVMLLFGLLFLIGTFNDHAIAQAVFTQKNTGVQLVTSVGVYPFCAAFVFLTGALFERAFHSGRGKTAKVILCLLCVQFAVFTGLVGAVTLLEKDCLGALFPNLSRNAAVISGVSIVGFYPLFFVGYSLARKTEDRYLAKRILRLIVIMLTAFILMEVLKNFFHRPRYRTVVLGYEGIGFVPWYTPFHGALQYAETFGLDRGEFRSFPSGHSILSISVVYILQSLTWFFPKLKERVLFLCTAGFLFGAVIMLTRMVLGAHYLSDVSAGAMIGTLLSLVHTLWQSRITEKQAVQTEIPKEPVMS